MNIFGKKKIVSISTGAIFKWDKGLCLKTTEESTFGIPGAIFLKNVPIGEILVIEEGDADMEFTKNWTENAHLPDLWVRLKKGVKIKLTRSSEVRLASEGEGKERKKDFIILEGNYTPITDSSLRSE